MNEHVPPGVAGTAIKVDAEKNQRDEYHRLCDLVGKNVRVDTSPRSSTAQPTKPGYTNIIEISIGADGGLVIKAKESFKDRGVSIDVSISRTAIPDIIALLLSSPPPRKI